MNQQTAAAALTQAGRWRKSSYSQGANDCVEIARVSGWAGVRDSKRGVTSPMVTLGLTELDALVEHLRLS